VTGELLEAALRYAAELGAAVVPIVGKRPAAAHGYASASSDPLEIRRLFAGEPRATGVGIQAGSRLVIIDVDRPEAIGELGPLPLTLSCRSGGGGWHLYFARPPGLQLSYRRDRFPAGVEVKLGVSVSARPRSRTVRAVRGHPVPRGFG
jgi:hypothetical protein